MIRLFFTFLAVSSITLNLYTQNYEARYTGFFNNEGSYVLTFNSSEWRFDDNTEWNSSVTFTSNDILLDEKEFSKEKKDQISLYKYYSLEKNYYLEEAIISLNKNDKCIIKGEMVKPEWEIINDSVKIIENYTCFMAKGDLCGMKFTVWFTPDIPVTCGPWRLWGLPGLIISALSDDDDGFFQMISLKKTDKRPQKPEVKKTIKKEEYKSLFEEEVNKITRNIQATSPNRFTIKTSVSIKTKDKCLLK